MWKRSIWRKKNPLDVKNVGLKLVVNEPDWSDLECLYTVHINTDMKYMIWFRIVTGVP